MSSVSVCLVMKILFITPEVCVVLLMHTCHIYIHSVTYIIILKLHTYAHTYSHMYTQRYMQVHMHACTNAHNAKQKCMIIFMHTSLQLQTIKQVNKTAANIKRVGRKCPTCVMTSSAVLEEGALKTVYGWSGDTL